MTEPKGFSSFMPLDEAKKKPKAKKRKESGGKDDQRYIHLMDEYKRRRGKERGEANRIHNQAIKLKAEGDVSQNAVTAGQYI